MAWTGSNPPPFFGLSSDTIFGLPGCPVDHAGFDPAVVYTFPIPYGLIATNRLTFEWGLYTRDARHEWVQWVNALLMAATECTEGHWWIGAERLLLAGVAEHEIVAESVSGTGPSEIGYRLWLVPQVGPDAELDMVQATQRLRAELVRRTDYLFMKANKGTVQYSKNKVKSNIAQDIAPNNTDSDDSSDSEQGDHPAEAPGNKRAAPQNQGGSKRRARGRQTVIPNPAAGFKYITPFAERRVFDMYSKFLTQIVELPAPFAENGGDIFMADSPAAASESDESVASQPMIVGLPGQGPAAINAFGPVDEMQPRVNHAITPLAFLETKRLTVSASLLDAFSVATQQQTDESVVNQWLTQFLPLDNYYICRRDQTLQHYTRSGLVQFEGKSPCVSQMIRWLAPSVRLPWVNPYSVLGGMVLPGYEPTALVHSAQYQPLDLSFMMGLTIEEKMAQCNRVLPHLRRTLQALIRQAPEKAIEHIVFISAHYRAILEAENAAHPFNIVDSAFVGALHELKDLEKHRAGCRYCQSLPTTAQQMEKDFAPDIAVFNVLRTLYYLRGHTNQCGRLIHAAITSVIQLVEQRSGLQANIRITGPGNSGKTAIALQIVACFFKAFIRIINMATRASFSIGCPIWHNMMNPPFDVHPFNNMAVLFNDIGDLSHIINELKVILTENSMSSVRGTVRTDNTLGHVQITTLARMLMMLVQNEGMANLELKSRMGTSWNFLPDEVESRDGVKDGCVVLRKTKGRPAVKPSWTAMNCVPKTSIDQERQKCTEYALRFQTAEIVVNNILLAPFLSFYEVYDILQAVSSYADMYPERNMHLKIDPRAVVGVQKTMSAISLLERQAKVRMPEFDDWSPIEKYIFVHCGVCTYNSLLQTLHMKPELFASKLTESHTGLVRYLRDRVTYKPPAPAATRATLRLTPRGPMPMDTRQDETEDQALTRGQKEYAHAKRVYSEVDPFVLVMINGEPYIKLAVPSNEKKCILQLREGLSHIYPGTFLEELYRNMIASDILHYRGELFLNLVETSSVGSANEERWLNAMLDKLRAVWLTTETVGTISPLAVYFFEGISYYVVTRKLHSEMGISVPPKEGVPADGADNLPAEAYWKKAGMDKDDWLSTFVLLANQRDRNVIHPLYSRLTGDYTLDEAVANSLRDSQLYRPGLAAGLTPVQLDTHYPHYPYNQFGVDHFLVKKDFLDTYLRNEGPTVFTFGGVPQREPLLGALCPGYLRDRDVTLMNPDGSHTILHYTEAENAVFSDTPRILHNYAQDGRLFNVTGQVGRAPLPASVFSNVDGVIYLEYNDMAIHYATLVMYLYATREFPSLRLLRPGMLEQTTFLVQQGRRPAGRRAWPSLQRHTNYGEWRRRIAVGWLPIEVYVYNLLQVVKFLCREQGLDVEDFITNITPFLGLFSKAIRETAVTDIPNRVVGDIYDRESKKFDWANSPWMMAGD